MGSVHVTTRPLRRRSPSRFAASKPLTSPRPGRAPARLTNIAPVAYYGVRTQHGAVAFRRRGDRIALLPLRRDVDASSHDFEWGSFGQGPLQLAVALLADAIGPVAARGLAREFCERVTSALPREMWALTHGEVIGHARAAGWRD